MNKDQQEKLRQAIYEKLVEKEAAEKKAAAPLTEETKPQAPLTGTEKYAKAVREQVEKDNRNRPKVIPEKTDLLAGEDNVTAAQLRQSNQELWNRMQSSMASLGGGGGDTSKALNRFGDSMHGKLIIGPYEEDSDRSFIEFDVVDVDSNLSLEAKERGRYINMSNWLTHDDNDSYPSDNNSREYSGVAYGQGKFVASTWMSYWLTAGGANDQSYISNAVAVSEDGENWSVQTFEDDPADSYYQPNVYRFFDASGIIYESNNDIWILFGGYGGRNDQVSIWWSEDADSWNPVITPQDGSVQPDNKAYYSAMAYSPLLNKFLAAPEWNRSTKKMLASSTDGRTWTYDSAGEEFDSAVRGNSHGIAWGNNKFVMSYPSRYDTGGDHFLSTGGIAWSHDGDSWNIPDVNYHLRDSYPEVSDWRGIVYAEDLRLFVCVAEENFTKDRDPFLWSPDGISWNHGTVHFKDRFSDLAEPEGTVFYADGKFIAPLGYAAGRDNLNPLLWWSVDGKNWYPSEVRRNDDMIADRWRGLAYAENKWVACSPSSAMVPKFATLEHNSKKNSLFVDGAIVATQDNLTPLFQKVNQLASRQNVIYSDSNPFDRDSYAANYITSGQLWFNSSTDAGQMYIRHRDSWVAI